MHDSTSALYAHLTELENRLEIETQRRAQAEAALRRLKKALETMQLGVTITDVDGKIVYTNPADSRMHGYEVEELIGQDVSVLGCPDNRRRLETTELEGMTSWHRERHNTRKDGSVFPVELLSDAVLDARGRPLGVITTCQDISSRRAAEQQLRDSHEQLEAQLRQAQKLEAVGQLTGGIAHDFNNMLAVVLANAELLVAYLPEDDEEDLRIAASDIQTAARASARMIERLLGFSRQAPLELIPADLGQLVGDTTAMLRRLIRQDIEIEVATDTPAGTVTADHAAVQQMLMNLVTNARDAMSEGGAIRIVVANEVLGEDEQQTHPWVQPGDYVCVSVSDTGTGMDAKTLKRVFEPFFTTKPQGQGTGLGLAMIYGLMKQHRGYVHVYSELGIGTTVAMHFPAIAACAERPSIPISMTSLERQDGTILLAEDEEIVRRTACRALERLGYRVLPAQDGADAIAIFHQHRNEIALVMSDMIMPKMGGRELYAAIRREDTRVPFLFTSGYQPDDVRERASLNEHTVVLQKPWKLDDLAAAVRHALDAVAL